MGIVTGLDIINDPLAATLFKSLKNRPQGSLMYEQTSGETAVALARIPKNVRCHKDSKRQMIPLQEGRISIRTPDQEVGLIQCRLCEKYYRERNIPEPSDSVEGVGHIQCYCPALQLPRIAIHHGIWRELMFSIRKSSTELNDASEPRWHFPSALSPEAHAEWSLYKILEYMGLHEILPPGAGKNGPNFVRTSKNTTSLTPLISTTQT